MSAPCTYTHAKVLRHLTVAEIVQRAVLSAALSVGQPSDGALDQYLPESSRAANFSLWPGRLEALPYFGFSFAAPETARPHRTD